MIGTIQVWRRVDHEHHHQGEGRPEHGEVHRVLAPVDDRPLGQPLLQLARRHQAAREDEEPEPDLDAEHGGRELVDLVALQVVVGGPDQGGRQPAEGVREGDPLGHRGHRDHQAQRDPDGRRRSAPRRRSARSPRSSCRARRASRRWRCRTRSRRPARPRRAVWGEVIHFSENANPSAATRYARLIQSMRLTGASRRPRRAPAAAARGARNIFSMRSVMRKPPTTLIVEATTAMKPRTCGVGRLGLAEDDDRAHQRDRRQGVGEGHQRRVQQLRHPPDQLEPEEGGQREDEEAGDDDLVGHDATPSSAPRAARTRSLTIAPSRATAQPATRSSSVVEAPGPRRAPAGRRNWRRSWRTSGSRGAARSRGRPPAR